MVGGGGGLKAMPPILLLKNVSGTMEGLTLNTLLRFLQAHFAREMSQPQSVN